MEKKNILNFSLPSLIIIEQLYQNIEQLIIVPVLRLFENEGYSAFYETKGDITGIFHVLENWFIANDYDEENYNVYQYSNNNQLMLLAILENHDNTIYSICRISETRYHIILWQQRSLDHLIPALEYNYSIVDNNLQDDLRESMEELIYISEDTEEMGSSLTKKWL